MLVSRTDLALVHTQKGKTNNQLGKVKKQEQLGRKAMGVTVTTDGWKIVREVRVAVMGVGEMVGCGVVMVCVFFPCRAR